MKKIEKELVMIPINLRFFEGEDKDSKTEEPTEQKRSKAREEGQVAMSQEVTTAITLIAMFFTLRLFGPWLYQNILGLMLFNWGGVLPHTYAAIDNLIASGYLPFLFQQVVVITLPLLLISMAAGVLSSVLQVGWKPTAKPMMPKFSKLNPISGFKKIFSMKSVVNLVKSLAKIGIVGSIVYYMVMAQLGNIPAMLDMSIMASSLMIMNFVINLGLTIGAVFIIIAALDFAYTRYEHTKKLRMTKQEVKDEYKQMEGDPHIKGKIRQRMREASMRRMMQNVPEADVVITNPTHFAVALRYNNLVDKAPVVTAKGADLMAKRIRDKAREHDVVIVENPPLARALYADVEVGDEIPFELWESVVEILAYVFKLKNRVS